MAKDNVPFHTVVFPSTLLGTSVDYTLLNHISSTEYLNYEDGKFSKSRSVGVFGNDAQDTGIPADIYRFYLLYVRPETQDSTFSWSDFITKNNSELLNNLGNFINRTLTFLKNNFKSTIPPMTLSGDDKMLLALINREIEGYIDCLEKLKIRDGLKYILNISRHGNGHIQAHKPWDMMKGDPNQRAHAGSVIGVCVNVCCLLSVLLQPYMPAVSQEIQSQLKAPSDCNVILEQFVPYLNEGHVIGEPYPLFKKFDESTAETFKKQFGGQQAHGAGGGAAANVESKATLESELEKQSNLVRELKKTGTASKERLDQEIAKLLEIKSKLGISTAGGNSKKKSKKGNK
jgi:methionyl-tRNA synthetase